jgi:DNA-binding MarR family transcriptional regulator
MTRWLDADQQRHWRALMTGTSALFDALNRDMEEAMGLSMTEYEVFVRLSEAPDRRMRMSALADSLVHSRSRITHTVRRLEERGLVSRCAATGDGRGVECRLTDTGMDLLEKAAPAHVESVRERLVDVLTPEQLTTVGDAFAAVATAIADPRVTCPDPFPQPSRDEVVRGA